MKILIGLGNPGEKYKYTRHNVGFQIVDAIAEKYSDLNWKNKFQGSYCTCYLKKEKFLILKPETFMNNSGQSVQAITSFYKSKSSDLIIFHDELDLIVGKIKVKLSGGHGGHNGLKSINQIFGDNYVRVRIGIDRPSEKKLVSSYVLSNFPMSDAQQIERAKKLILSEIPALVSENYKGFSDNIYKKALRSLKKSELQITEPEFAHTSDPSNDPLPENNKNLSFLAKLLGKKS
tara:strand:+ start:69 stop:767 length:699 start_codon:yes stop_codon:yes gene_type:complete